MAAADRVVGVRGEPHPEYLPPAIIASDGMRPNTPRSAGQLQAPSAAPCGIAPMRDQIEAWFRLLHCDTLRQRHNFHPQAA
jgi:hypothetical protein